MDLPWLSNTGSWWSAMLVTDSFPPAAEVNESWLLKCSRVLLWGGLDSAIAGRGLHGRLDPAGRGGVLVVGQGCWGTDGGVCRFSSWLMLLRSESFSKDELISSSWKWACLSWPCCGSSWPLVAWLLCSCGSSRLLAVASLSCSCGSSWPLACLSWPCCGSSWPLVASLSCSCGPSWPLAVASLSCCGSSWPLFSISSHSLVAIPLLGVTWFFLRIATYSFAVFFWFYPTFFELFGEGRSYWFQGCLHGRCR